jgi:hypothetical protein
MTGEYQPVLSNLISVLAYAVFMSVLGLVGCHNEPPISVQDASHPVAPRIFKTLCAGSDHPVFRVVFLQGIQTEQLTSRPIAPDQTATDYPAMLDAVGNKLNIQFAIPQSNVLCKNSQNRYCWGSAEPSSVAEVYAIIRHSAAQCFSLDQPWGLLGFSNGGYHVGRIIAQGHTPQPAWAMAIGSAGNTTIVNAYNVAKRTPFYLSIGTEDISKDDARHFFNALDSSGFNVHYDEFAGGHELTEAILSPLLKNVLQ